MTRNQRSAIDQIEWMRNLLAFLLVGAFIACIPLLFFRAFPEGNEATITYIMGQLSGMAITVLGFYFVNKVGQDALDAKRTENTATALETIKEVSKNAAGTTDAAAEAADATAEAAKDKAEEFKP